MSRRSHDSSSTSSNSARNRSSSSSDTTSSSSDTDSDDDRHRRSTRSSDHRSDRDDKRKWRGDSSSRRRKEEKRKKSSTSSKSRRSRNHSDDRSDDKHSSQRSDYSRRDRDESSHRHSRSPYHRHSYQDHREEQLTRGEVIRNWQNSMRIKIQRDKKNNELQVKEIESKWRQLEHDKKAFEDHMRKREADVRRDLEHVAEEDKRLQDTLSHCQWWDKRLNERETKLLQDCIKYEQHLAALQERTKKIEEEDERLRKKHLMLIQDEIRLQKEKDVLLEFVAKCSNVCNPGQDNLSMPASIGLNLASMGNAVPIALSPMPMSIAITVTSLPGTLYASIFNNQIVPTSEERIVNEAAESNSLPTNQTHDDVTSTILDEATKNDDVIFSSSSSSIQIQHDPILIKRQVEMDHNYWGVTRDEPITVTIDDDPPADDGNASAERTTNCEDNNCDNQINSTHVAISDVEEQISNREEGVGGNEKEMEMLTCPTVDEPSPPTPTPPPSSVDDGPNDEDVANDADDQIENSHRATSTTDESQDEEPIFVGVATQDSSSKAVDLVTIDESNNKDMNGAKDDPAQREVKTPTIDEVGEMGRPVVIKTEDNLTEGEIDDEDEFEDELILNADMTRSQDMELENEEDRPPPVATLGIPKTTTLAVNIPSIQRKPEVNVAVESTKEVARNVQISQPKTVQMATRTPPQPIVPQQMQIISTNTGGTGSSLAQQMQIPINGVSTVLASAPLPPPELRPPMTDEVLSSVPDQLRIISAALGKINPGARAAAEFCGHHTLQTEIGPIENGFTSIQASMAKAYTEEEMSRRAELAEASYWQAQKLRHEERLYTDRMWKTAEHIEGQRRRQNYQRTQTQNHDESHQWDAYRRWAQRERYSGSQGEENGRERRTHGGMTMRQLRRQAWVQNHGRRRLNNKGYTERDWSGGYHEEAIPRSRERSYSEETDSPYWY